MIRLLLAPDLQEEILFLPPMAGAHNPLTERELGRVLRPLFLRRQRQVGANLGNRL